jgi:UDP-N-acetylglucosamine acyltransferase
MRVDLETLMPMADDMSRNSSKIHPTAIIHSEADLHPTVEVGPYTVIGAGVKIGPQTQIGAHVVLEGPTEIGANNRIFPGAAIGLEPQDKKYAGEQSWVKIGDGNCIREYVTINRATGEGEATCIGNHNLLLAYVHVAHNCVLEDWTTISNAATLAGHVHVESQATISGVLGIHQFVHIGRLSMIGGMSRVDRDVPPFMLVEGSPPRVRSLNLVGLKRAGIGGTEQNQVLRTLKKALRILYRAGLPLNEALEQLELLPRHESILHLQQFCRGSLLPGRRGLTPGQRSSRAEDH